MSVKTNFWNRWVLLWVAAFTAAGVHMFLDQVTSSLPTGTDNHTAKAFFFNASKYFNGYDSIDQMHGRSQRFPSIDERVRVYMSNWYAPGCEDNTSAKSYVSYRMAHDGLHDQLIVEELLTNATFNGSEEISPRRFLIDSQNTLGKLHFLDDRNMLPQNCDSEYCVDMIRYLLPSLNRVDTQNVPIIFQFSDEETSRAFSIGSQSNETYPAVPHFKKSRISLLYPRRKILDDRQLSCHPPFPSVSVEGHAVLPPHFHPSTCALSTWHERLINYIFQLFSNSRQTDTTVCWTKFHRKIFHGMKNETA